MTYPGSACTHGCYELRYMHLVSRHVTMMLLLAERSSCIPAVMLGMLQNCIQWMAWPSIAVLSLELRCIKLRPLTVALQRANRTAR